MKRQILSIVSALSFVAASSAWAAEDRVSTMQPFEKGDVFVASSVMDDPDDDHAGTGRLIQYDADLNEKGVLWIEGTRHKVGGLNFGPDGTLWGFAQLTPVVLEFSPDGRQKPIRKYTDRTYSTITFGQDGSLYFGEHLQGQRTDSDLVSTTFNLLPGRDVIGDGHIFRHNADGELVQEYKTDTHGGIEGYLAVTSTVLVDDDTRMVYVSETGNRVMQYDLKNDKQLPDLANFEGHPTVGMVLNMNPMKNGDLMISTGTGILALDPKTGELKREYELEGAGWATMAAHMDGEHIYTGNFFTGELVKMRLSDGEIVARAQTGQQKSLSGLIQYPG